MIIPKYVDEPLIKRTRLDQVCMQVDAWLDHNDISPDSSCYHTGVETYVNPHRSEEEVRRAIHDK